MDKIPALAVCIFFGQFILSIALSLATDFNQKIVIWTCINAGIFMLMILSFIYWLLTVK